MGGRAPDERALFRGESLSRWFSDEVSPPAQGHPPTSGDIFGGGLEEGAPGINRARARDTAQHPAVPGNTLSCPRNNDLSPNVKPHVLEEVQPHRWDCRRAWRSGGKVKAGLERTAGGEGARPGSQAPPTPETWMSRNLDVVLASSPRPQVGPPITPAAGSSSPPLTASWSRLSPFTRTASTGSFLAGPPLATIVPRGAESPFHGMDPIAPPPLWAAPGASHYFQDGD